MSGTGKIIIAAGLALGLGAGAAHANAGPEHGSAGASEGVNFTVGACPPDETEAEHAKHASHEPSHKMTTRHQMKIKHDFGSGEVYELRASDGNVIVLRNGEKVHAKRLKRVPGKVVVLGDDGDELTTFELEGMGHPPESGFVQKMWIGEGDKGAKVVVEHDMGFTPGGDASFAKAHPPVMLGIRMGEPGPALRTHLRLGKTDAILVEGVTEGLAAERAGLKKYDVIVSVDGSGEANGEVLHKALSKKSPGDELRLIVVRGCDKVRLTAELDAYDARKLSANNVWFGEKPGGAEAEVFKFRAAPQIATGRPFIWRDHRDELMESLHEKLRGRLSDEQLEQAHRAIREALEGADFEFDMEFGGPDLEGLGVMEFRWDGKDHKLVIPKEGQWRTMLEDGLPHLREGRRHEAHEAEREHEEITRRLSERLERLSEEIERLRESLDDLD